MPTKSFYVFPIIRVKVRGLSVKDSHHITISDKDIARGQIVICEDNFVFWHRPDERTKPVSPSVASSYIQSSDQPIMGSFLAISNQTGPQYQLLCLTERPERTFSSRIGN